MPLVYSSPPPIPYKCQWNVNPSLFMKPSRIQSIHTGHQRSEGFRSLHWEMKEDKSTRGFLGSLAYPPLFSCYPVLAWLSRSSFSPTTYIHSPELTLFDFLSLKSSEMIMPVNGMRPLHTTLTNSGDHLPRFPAVEREVLLQWAQEAPAGHSWP